MDQINRIEPADIQRLDGGQLVRLLDILLQSEARTRNITRSGIHVPYQITVRDGGSDGEWRGKITPCDFIPNAFTRYQCKAENIAPGKCEDEMLDSSGQTLKPAVREVLESGGAYVFFCSHGFPETLIGDRLTRARAAVTRLGLSQTAANSVHFLDGNMIARWTNMHAGALSFVCRSVRISQPTLMLDYRQWEGVGDFNRWTFHTTDALDAHMAAIRSEISVPGGSIRITGLSGLGKTRLAFEAFHRPCEGSAQDEQARRALCSSMAFIDFAIAHRDVLGWVQQLVVWGIQGIVVVDNCPQEVHAELEKLLLHRDNRLSLLTLDYVPDKVRGRGGRQIVLTEEIMREVVPRILASVPGLKESIGEAGIHRVADFAQGFPQIAILIAEAGQALDIGTLNNQGRIAHRLLWGRETADPNAEKVIRCLAAFTEIGCDGRYHAQLKFLLDTFLGGMDESEFLDLTRMFRKNRIIQRVGDFLMVTPPPLAVALAADWLDTLTEKRFDSVLAGIESCGLTDSFARRLSQLDFSERAQQLSDRLMGAAGPLSSAEVLNSKAGSRVFRALSEVNPPAALRCLVRIFGGQPPASIKDVGDGRRDLVWALEKLCWPADQFAEAARLLRTFAAGENEHWANNATGIFKRLFHILLPGTRCPLGDRLAILEEGLASPYPEVGAVCVEALGAALESDRFSRSGGVELRGSRLPEDDYRPVTNSEVWDYWRKVFQMLASIILQDEPHLLAEKSGNTLGSHMEGILLSPLARELMPRVAEIVVRIGGVWPIVRENISNLLEYRKNLSESQRAVLQECLLMLTPSEIKGRLRDLVAMPGWHHVEVEGGALRDLSEEGAVALADELSTSSEDWLPHVDVLLHGEQQQTFAFGARIAELSSQPEALFDTCLERFRATPEEKRNPQLLRGILRGIGSGSLSRTILERVASDPVLRAEILVPLAVSITPTLDDFRWIVGLVLGGGLKAEQIRTFAYGSVSKGWSADDLAALLRELVVALPGSAPVALDIAFMHWLGAKDSLNALRSLFEDLVQAPSVIASLDKGNIGHAWESIVTVLLRAPSPGFPERLAEGMVAEVSKLPFLTLHTGHAPGVLARLLSSHCGQVWPVVARNLRGQDGTPNQGLVELVCRHGIFDDTGCPLWEVTPEAFREWAKENPEILPAMLRHLPLFRVEKQDRSAPTDEVGALDQTVEAALGASSPQECYVWHPIALTVLEMCGTEDLFELLYCNLFSFGSSGSRVPYLEKRLARFSDLANGGDPRLQAVARRIIPMIGDEIAGEKKLDAQHAAGIFGW